MISGIEVGGRVTLPVYSILYIENTKTTGTSLDTALLCGIDSKNRIGRVGIYKHTYWISTAVRLGQTAQKTAKKFVQPNRLTAV